MMIIGITGPICSGKTTLLEYFEKIGEQVISVDSLYHQWIKKGEFLNKILTDKYSLNILKENGDLDTSLLRKKVFSQQNGIDELNKLIHPLLFSKAYEIALEKAEKSPHKRVFVEAAVIIESGFLHKNNANILIWIEKGNQISRIQKRDNVSLEIAEKKIAVQLDFQKYLSHFRWIYQNRGNVSELEGFGQKIINEISSEEK